MVLKSQFYDPVDESLGLRSLVWVDAHTVFNYFVEGQAFVFGDL